MSDHEHGAGHHHHGEDNDHAGRGTSVLLDIGGDVGAVILTAPAQLLGAEIEARPVGAGAPVHASVLPRPLPDGRSLPSVVLGTVPAGTYDLYVRPDGPVRLTVTVAGGTVTESAWPTD